MRAIVQRVTQAAIQIADTKHAEIGEGLLVYACVSSSDEHKEFEWLAKKIISLRIFDDANGKFSYSVLDIAGAILLVPNFTLLAEVKKGNRPYFSTGISAEEAKVKYETFVALMAQKIATQSGVFGATMLVDAQVRGPVNIVIDSP